MLLRSQFFLVSRIVCCAISNVMAILGFPLEPETVNKVFAGGKKSENFPDLAESWGNLQKKVGTLLLCSDV